MFSNHHDWHRGGNPPLSRKPKVALHRGQRRRSFWRLTPRWYDQNRRGEIPSSADRDRTVWPASNRYAAPVEPRSPPATTRRLARGRIENKANSVSGHRIHKRRSFQRGMRQHPSGEVFLLPAHYRLA